MMRKKQQGFSAVQAIMIIVVVVALFAAAWILYSSLRPGITPDSLRLQ